jgi:hypothetical protein
MYYIYARTISSNQVIKCNGLYERELVDSVVGGLNGKFSGIVFFWKEEV